MKYRRHGEETKKKNHSEKIKRVFNWRPEGARRRHAAVTS